MKKPSLSVLLIGFAAVLILGAASYVPWIFKSFYSHQNSFIYYVNNYDRRGAQSELDLMKQDYSRLSGLGLQYFADKFLMNDTILNEGRVNYLGEDYEKVIDGPLKDSEDYRAKSLIAVSKFMLLRAEYQAEKVKNPKVKDSYVGRILKELEPEFRQVVEEGPGPIECFYCSFNYDLVSNPEDAAKALEEMPRPKFVLGLEVKQGEPGPGKKDMQMKVDDPAPGRADEQKKG